MVRHSHSSLRTKFGLVAFEILMTIAVLLTFCVVSYEMTRVTSDKAKKSQFNSRKKNGNDF